MNAPMRRCPSLMSAALALAVLAGAAAGSHAQQVPGTHPEASELDSLRAENELLRAELARARGALDEALRRLAAAEAALARLSATSEGAGDDGGDGAVDAPADPLASPSSLLAELRRRYERDLGELRADPAALRPAVAAWCKSVRTELRGRRVWLVTISPLEEEGASPRPEAFVRVYDEALLRPIGGPVRVRIPSRHAAQVRARPDQRLWTLTATVAGAPVFQERRDAAGVFNYPPFVGPYAEFGFELDWHSLTASNRTLPRPAREAPVEPPPPPPGPPR